MKEFALDEFVFHYLFGTEEELLIACSLLMEIFRTCCKIVVNPSVMKKYNEELKAFSRIAKIYSKFSIVPAPSSPL